MQIMKILESIWKIMKIMKIIEIKEFQLKITKIIISNSRMTEIMKRKELIWENHKQNKKNKKKLNSI